LRDVLQSVSGLNQSLAVLQSAELIAIKQRVPELVYIFKNSLARDVVYKRTLLQKRRALHAKTGQAIEALFADRLEEFYGLLAYHYAQAEAWGPAQDYLLKAGDQAGQVASGIEALNHYALALKAYENAFGQRWDTLQRATLARKMGDAHYGLGRMPESRDYYQDVLALLDKPLPGSRLGLFTGLIGQVFRQLLHRLWPARFIDLAAIEKRAALREVVNTYERLGVIFYIEGEAATSVYTFLRSLNLAEQNGSSPELARAYANNVIAASIIPPLRFMADRYSKLALEITRNIDDLATQAWVWELTGIFHVGMGRWKEAVHAEQQAAEINKRIGRLRWWEESIGVLSQTMHYRGQFASAREGYLELLASGQERGDRQTQVWGLAGLAESGLRLGVPGHQDEIITMLERAKALLDEYRFPNRPDEIQVYGLAAYVRLRRQEWALASQAAHRATGLINIEWPPSTFYTFESYAALPIVYLELWQAQLDGRFKPAKHENYQKLAQKAVRNLRNFARIFPMATPRAVLLQGLYEWCTERPERARALWQKSLDQAQRREMPFDVGLAHYEIGVHSPSESPAREEHLRRAVQIFTDLGAAWKLDQAQRALEN